MFGKLSVAVLGLMCSSAYAESIDQPALKAGDNWVYTVTVETGQQGFSRKEELVTVERVDSNDVLISTRQNGSNQPPIEAMMGRDWSRSRDINGKQEVVNRPFEFPLVQDKKWTVDYTEQHPNRLHTSETFHNDYVVTGWEDIQVPAGTFRAMKIEAQGQWTAVVAPTALVGAQALATPGAVTTVAQAQHTASRTASGSLYKAFWYVPAEKRFVKSIEEYYSSKGIRSERYTMELNSAKVS
ncbi:hypothetical protein [Pseudomonas vanderleydeniana]|uniref:DUF3857 domain-containing protein n=1 Tax=Pseudomonas vanderleydeniana TaxID=2745495 RepID=A0A9E6TU77_9PSED|nr:hypothetical protein [Pseudomonas vanderleydeniana]QXI30537.1 hypothetical protein HU752_011570 [Pseudomonas vanderleydeniana]